MAKGNGQRNGRALGIVIAAAVVVALAGAREASAGEPQFTTIFNLERCSWANDGTQNRHFSLKPGYTLVLEGEEEDEGELVEIEVEIKVLDAKKSVTFTTPSGRTLTVNTRIVREREWVDGELVEVSRNFFARCTQTGDIFYFGETVDDYEDGEIVGHGGSWLAGRNGAQPGLMMPGRFLLGSRYFQEMAPGVAMDRGENTAMGLTIETEAGTFRNCVEVIDTNALHPEQEGDQKIYCPGIGLVIDEDAELTDYGF